MGAKEKNTMETTEKQPNEAKMSLSGSKSGRRHLPPDGEIDAKRSRESIGDTLSQSNQSITRSIDQTIDQTIHQSITQSIDQSTNNGFEERNDIPDCNDSTMDESSQNEMHESPSLSGVLASCNIKPIADSHPGYPSEEKRGRHRRNTCGDGNQDDTTLPFDEKEQSEFYEAQMADFSVQPWQLKSRLPVKPVDIETTSPIKVQTVAGLLDLIADLSKKDIPLKKKGKEIAVDLEFYRERSTSNSDNPVGKSKKPSNAASKKLGLKDFMCLLQVSTRKLDYVVVPFPIWENVKDLNKIFANPDILKVLHDCRQDIEFLRKDFGIYMVNVFDTHRGMVKLKLEGTPSYKNLVGKYCKVELDKTNQTSDWRKRDLSAEQIDYSRNDTHYLLYCYDELREAMLVKENGSDLLLEVYKYGHRKCKTTILYSPGTPPTLCKGKGIYEPSTPTDDMRMEE